MTQPIRIAHVATVDSTLRFILLGQLRRLKAEGFEVATVSAPGPYVTDIESEGIRHIAWPHVTRSWDLRADIRAYHELARILRSERFDLVHTHNPKPGVMGRVAARRGGVPCVVNSVHGFYASPQDSLRKRIPVLAVERVAARFSDFELYASREDLAWARRIGIVNTSKSRFLGNGIDLQHFDPSAVSDGRLATLRRELGIPERSLVVGAVGRLVAEKGYRELFAAASEVRRALPEVRFIVLGSPDRAKPDAITSVEIERAKRDIIFTGWVDDIRDLLGLMDIFVLPSWREGQPVAAMEASAMGKPLILTNIRGCREVATDGSEALLIPPRSTDLLTSAILHLLGDSVLRHRLGQAARARAVRDFDERRIMDRLIGLYRSLLVRKGIKPPRSFEAPSRGLRNGSQRSRERQASLRPET